MPSGVSKALTAIVVTALSIVFVTISYASLTLPANDYNGPYFEMYDEVVFSNYSVMVFSDSARFSFFVESLDNSTSNVTLADSFNISLAEVIIIVDRTWFEDNDENATVEGLNELILQGNPVLFFTDNPDFLLRVGIELEISGDVDGVDVCAIQNRPDGGSYSFGAIMEEESISLIHAYNWAVTRLQN